MTPVAKRKPTLYLNSQPDLLMSTLIKQQKVENTELKLINCHRKIIHNLQHDKLADPLFPCVHKYAQKHRRLCTNNKKPSKTCTTGEA